MFNKISKRITYYLGGLAIILAGLLYLVMTDLTFGNTSFGYSPWLYALSVAAFVCCSVPTLRKKLFPTTY